MIDEGKQMKKINKIAKVFFTTLAVFSAINFAGCELLQSTLSDQMREQLEKETGVPKLESNVFYYNGTSQSDVSGQNVFLKIDFGGVKVKLNPSGLSGNFIVLYKNNSEKALTQEISFDSVIPGDFNEDGTVYYLNLKPVLNFLNGTTALSNEIIVQVKVNGFVCAEGNQKGRSVSVLNKSIQFKPLYNEQTLEANIFTTKSAASGTVFSIPVNGPVSIKNGSVSVKGLALDTSWTCRESKDGMSIELLCDTDLTGVDTEDVEFTVKGIVPRGSGTEYTQSFGVDFVCGVVSSSSISASDFDISKMTVFDDGNENLIVKIDFASANNLWKYYKLTLLIDNVSCTNGKSYTNESWWTDACEYPGVGSYTDIKNGSVETEITSILAENQGSVKNGIRYYSATENLDKPYESFTGTDFAVQNDADHSGGSKLTNSTVTYTIPFSYIGGLKAGDTVRVFAATSNCKWNSNDAPVSVGILDLIPQASISEVTSSVWAGGATTYYKIDMSKALEYIVE